MPADRDQRRRVITPPKGVTPPAGQRTEEPESWEDAGHETPLPVDPVESLHVIGRRVKVTARNAQATLDEVGKLRGELDQMREAGARREGTLAEIKATLDEERKERRMYTAVGVSAYQGRVDADQQRALSQIESESNRAAAALVERTDRVRWRREIVIKIFAAVAAVWAVISAILLAK